MDAQHLPFRLREIQARIENLQINLIELQRQYETSLEALTEPAQRAALTGQHGLCRQRQEALIVKLKEVYRELEDALPRIDPSSL